MLEDTNQRHLQIEKMTKEAAIRHNQLHPGGESISERNNGATTVPIPVEPPIPAPIPPPPLGIPSTRIVVQPAPPPTIEDDRTFLAKMSEQEALVNQLNSIATREAVSRNGLLVMEGALLNALRPLTMPFLGAGPPIPGHFVPFQRMQRPIEQSPVENNIEVQSRPPAAQLPMRANNLETYEFQKDDELAEMVIRNETAQLI
ncbi:Protein CBG14912 [Caenorhabditis briggsae]|nr:Protein CBG14912 [Caenorhabditis briggsae]CAP33316.2 Protein CBG14912 [Caenorhabditis briggsae]